MCCVVLTVISPTEWDSKAHSLFTYHTIVFSWLVVDTRSKEDLALGGGVIGVKRFGIDVPESTVGSMDMLEAFVEFTV